ncbi:MAG: radical SAM protein [Candidatus Omnitrophica bacterium]|nr:radical SAM protein [Candidatus Omnitrophota bacterium]
MVLVNPYAGVNRDIPNLALVYIATYLKTKVVDLNTLPSPYYRFLKYKHDSVGISVQSRTYNEALKIKNIYKKKNPEVKVYSVSGILDVQCCYPYLRLEEDIHIELDFSDDLPFPVYELFDSFFIFKNNWQQGKWQYPLMTSQGCPYSCIYCASRNRSWQLRSVDNCYEELKMAKERYSIKSFVILDDCFNIDKERVLRFCEKVQPLGLSWSCANGLRLDRFDEDIAIALKNAGCNFISFGIESVDTQILAKIKKGENLEQIEKAIDIARSYFKDINGYFIIGLPGSSFQKDIESLNWAKRRNINAFFSYYIPPDELNKGYLFYGRGARPVSDAYPHRLQKKIYILTRYMRPPSEGILNLKEIICNLKDKIYFLLER